MFLLAYGDQAYRSELSLFRARGVAASEAEPVEVADDACALFRVDLGDGAPVFCTDPHAALATYAGLGGWGITQLVIV